VKNYQVRFFRTITTEEGHGLDSGAISGHISAIYRWIRFKTKDMNSI
jgi:hypothetical protein